MTLIEVRPRLLPLIAEQAVRPVVEITDDQVLVKDLDFDSLDRIELSMAAEDEFGFQMTDAEAEVFWKLKTVGDVIDFVATKVSGGAA